MEGLGLFPNNCYRCGFWTATELQRRPRGWALICTHCGGTQEVRGDGRRFRSFVDGLQRFVETVPEHFPELARLRIRGAYTTYQHTAKRPAR